MRLALAMMLLLSTGCAHMTPTQQRIALYCNPLSQGLNLVALTLGLGLAFFGGIESMDRSAKFFPLQHCVDAVQDDRVAQSQLGKPQAATAAASPAKPSSGPPDD
jgi:hypothetical protein